MITNKYISWPSLLKAYLTRPRLKNIYIERHRVTNNAKELQVLTDDILKTC